MCVMVFMVILRSHNFSLINTPNANEYEIIHIEIIFNLYLINNEYWLSHTVVHSSISTKEFPLCKTIEIGQYMQ